MGTYSADQEGAKVLRLYDIGVGVDLSGSANSISVAAAIMNISDVDYIIATFKDEENTIAFNQVELFENTISNATRVFYVTYSNSSANDFEIQNVLTNKSYENSSLYIRITATTDEGKIITYNKQLKNDLSRPESFSILFEEFDSTQIQWAIVILLSIVAIMGTMATRNMINIAFIGLALLFIKWGMLSWTGVTFAVAIIVVVLSALKSQLGGDRP